MADVLNPKRIIVGISGASGAIFGVRILEVLKENNQYESHLVISQSAEITLEHETDWSVQDVRDLANANYASEDVGAAIASGSFTVDSMIIAPCSIKTLSSVANSYADNLVSRAADVQLKERRPLLLMVRETPLHIGHLRLMTLATEAGAIVMPPVPAFYTMPQTIEDLINETVYRALSMVGIKNVPHFEWKG